MNRLSFMGAVAVLAATVTIAMSQPAAQRVATARPSAALETGPPPVRNCCGTPASRAAMLSRLRSEATLDGSARTQDAAREPSVDSTAPAVTNALHRAIDVGSFLANAVLHFVSGDS